MRNWNNNIGTFVTAEAQWFYLTYEELKPRKSDDTLKVETTILSYLWGIETKYWFRCSGVSNSDFILPMRNWNQGLLSRRLCLPTFYLTYEELKLTSTTDLKDLPNWFYLTYEELKQKLEQRNIREGCVILSYLWGIETKIQGL